MRDSYGASTGTIVSLTTLGIFVVVGLIVLGMWGCPTYSVYSAKMEGEAVLAKANYSKQVAVQEANAKMQSASLLAQADTIRAHGTARANIIIGQSLTASYLDWYWVENLDKTQSVIYVPTEANMPIMEAGRTPKNDYWKANTEAK